MVVGLLIFNFLYAYRVDGSTPIGFLSFLSFVAIDSRIGIDRSVVIRGPRHVQ